MYTLSRTLHAWLASRTFFRIVIGFFIVESLWFVCSAIYPMAFDEDFHFGLIKIYAQHWLPFLSDQPHGADVFGAVVRDPSYLYHYLMSFPYRLVASVTQQEAAQVITLRLINVAMFTSALLLFAKVIKRAKATPALVNVILAVFVLIPIVSQLAAHINYDNMLILVLPGLCLGAFRILDDCKQRQIHLVTILQLLLLCLGISLIKYAALPFVLATVLFLLAYMTKSFYGHHRELWPVLRHDFSSVPKIKLCMLAVLVAGAIGLCVQRYGVNMVTYKTLVPSCEQVISEQQCSKYGPWRRDHTYEQHRNTSFQPQVLSYMNEWLKGMHHRLFFAVNGAKSYFTNYEGLPVPMYTAKLLGIVGLALLVFCWRSILRDNTYLVFLATLVSVYVLILWLEGFEAYGRTGVAVAINGRYLLPILPFVGLLIGRAFHVALRAFPQTKTWCAVAVLLLFLQGGGVFTFILRSDESWYWHNSTVIQANHLARSALKPFIIGSQRH